MVSISTNGVARVLTERRPPGAVLARHGLFCTRYIDDLWVLGGFIKSAGDTLQWLCELLGAELPAAERFERLTAEAAACAPGADGLRFVPGLYGMGAPDPTDEPCAAFLRLARSHGRGHLTRAVLEGICCGIRRIGERLGDIASPWGTVFCAGGGAQNALWRQMLADVLGRDLRAAGTDSLLGAAVVAAKAAGLFATYREAAEAMTDRGPEPTRFDAETAARYEAVYRDHVSLAALVRAEGKGADAP